MKYSGYADLGMPPEPKPLTMEEAVESLRQARAHATAAGLRSSLETLAEGRGSTYEEMFGDA